MHFMNLPFDLPAKPSGTLPVSSGPAKKRNASLASGKPSGDLPEPSGVRTLMLKKKSERG